MISFQLNYGIGDIDRAKVSTLEKLGQAMLYATDKAGRNALSKIKSNGALGRFNGIIRKKSDKAGGKVYKRGSGSFSASSVIYLKKRGARTDGAIQSLTQEKTEITGKTSPWLWIATPELGIKRVGRKRITPALYKSSGLESRLGPLVSIPGSHPGERLLIVNNVQVRSVGSGRPIKGSRSGRARAGREQKPFIVAFVGILKTTRAQKIDVIKIVRDESSNLPLYISERL